MRRTVLLLALLLLAFAPAPRPRDWNKIDLEKMQGEWVLVRESQNGPPRPKRDLGASFKRDRFTFFPEADPLAGEWTVALAAGGKLKTIDLKKGDRLILAVYSLEGDTFALSWNITAEPVRPRAFPGPAPFSCQLTFKRKAP